LSSVPDIVDLIRVHWWFNVGSSNKKPVPSCDGTGR
jgi:hypothetical protein